MYYVLRCYTFLTIFFVLPTTVKLSLCSMYGFAVVFISPFDSLILADVKILDSGYFAINDILSLEAILLSDICDWSILMT